LPLVFLRAMKKYLPALAVLALAGCAHSQYRTTYLEEYAGHDCIELQAERLTVEAELDPRWRQGYSSRNAPDSVQSFAVTHTEPPHTIYDVYPASIDVNPARVMRQKDRLRNHAKWQALVRLEQNKSCVPEAVGGGAVAGVPSGY